MIYTCQHCGAWFPTREVYEATRDEKDMITCRYCGSAFLLKKIRTENKEMSSIDSGYDYLSTGNFFQALEKFTASIKFAEDRSTVVQTDKRRKPMASSEAYLGAALAQMHVQVIYSDKDNERKEQPVFICHTCDGSYFADNDYYTKAWDSVTVELGNYPVDEKEEHKRLERIQKYIDAFRDEYMDVRAKYASKPRTVFIAYEDDPLSFSQAGYEIAQKVQDFLPDIINSHAFMPYIDESTDNDEEREQELIRYEAEILNAIQTAKAMIVIADNNIDARLRSIYTRFYESNTYSRSYGRKKGNNLGFVYYQNRIPITLPNDEYAKDDHVFWVGESEWINWFVYSCNGFHAPEPNIPRLTGPGKTLDTAPTAILTETAVTLEETPPENTRSKRPELTNREVPYELINENTQVLFGHYPQVCVSGNQRIKDYFEELGTPALTIGVGWEDNGWTPLLYNRKGKVYTWIRDEMIDGKKYRGVFFRTYRDMFSVQDTDQVDDQIKNGYRKNVLHCFEFRPILWNVEIMGERYATLLSDMGLDCMEYNATIMENAWDRSTLHRWLNTDFLSTAFNEKERVHLGMLANSTNDQITLLDKETDVGFYEVKKRAILGSDYYRCLGGKGENTISYFWIDPHDIHDGYNAPIVYLDSQMNAGEQYVDCTNVAVLPKITLVL